MSNVESNSLHPAGSAGRVAPQSSRGLGGGKDSDKAGLARAFLLHLVSREIQLSGHLAGWLRSTAQGLTQRQLTELSADCVRLAAETWELREQLLAVAHRLAARRNRGVPTARRVNVMQLLEQPHSAAMLAFIELNQQIVASATPGVELAVVTAVEQLLSGVVPLAIDVAGFDGEIAADLAEVGEAYEARFARADALRRLTAAFAAAAPECKQALREAGDSAIAHYTEIIRESAELSRDGRRTPAC